MHMVSFNFTPNFIYITQLKNYHLTIYKIFRRAHAVHRSEKSLKKFSVTFQAARSKGWKLLPLRIEFIRVLPSCGIDKLASLPINKGTFID